jgi:membrane protease YdiL (CAAX protease family)
MTPNFSSPEPSPITLGLLVWALGIPGVLAVIGRFLPALLSSSSRPLPLPLPVVLLASLVQGAAFTGLAAWAGAVLGPRVGLGAPVLQALLARAPVGRLLSRSLAVGAIGAMVGGVFLVAALRGMPTALGSIPKQLTPPPVVRVLYGGITEEVLMRWGVMTLLLWLVWRLGAHEGAPHGGEVWSAIVVSALLFGAAHLPAIAALTGRLTPAVAGYVVATNAAFGVLAGYLYWRTGLESAIVAHAGAHILSLGIELLRS